MVMTYPSQKVDVSSALNEKFCYIHISVVRRDVQRRESIESARVNLCLPVQQNFGDAVMSAMRSHVQGG